MMSTEQVLERFAEYVKTHLAPMAEPEYWPLEKRDRAKRYQELVNDARWTYLRLRAGGDAVTILRRFRDSKVHTGNESQALTRLIDEVRR